MNGAKHGYWCHSRTWPTRCSACGEKVFFFNCDCNCRVFFDDLGPPWPIHDCNTSWTRNLKRTTDSTGKITVELREGITISRESDSGTFVGIEQEFIDRVQHAQKALATKPIVAVEPKDNSVRPVIGVMREVIREASPFIKYKKEDTTVGRAMLGSLGKQKIGRITIHAPTSETTQMESFSFWIPSALIEDSRITRGLTVSLTLAGIWIPDYGYAWFSDEFEVIG